MNKTVKITAIVLSAFVVLNSKPVCAELVTIEVEGMVTEVYTFGGLELDDSVTYGSTMTGSCSYDTDTPDQFPDDPSTGFYSLISLSIALGSYTFTDDGGFMVVSAGKNFGYYAYSYLTLSYGPCWVDGEPHNLEDIVSSALSQMYLGGENDGTITDALLDADSFPDLSAFNCREFYVGNDGGLSFGISGEITSITVIPEPGTALLFAFGGLVLLRKRGK
jgi:hypothetical protein